MDYCPEIKVLLGDTIRRGDCCMDLGANIGLLTVVMAELAGPEGTVIAVEPNAASLENLERTVAGCGLRQVRAVLGGVRDADAGAWFARTADSANRSRCDRPAMGAWISFLTPGLVADHAGGRLPDFVKV